jgi:hypothetical protein
MDGVELFVRPTMPTQGQISSMLVWRAHIPVGADNRVSLQPVGSSYNGAGVSLYSRPSASHDNRILNFQDLR